MGNDAVEESPKSKAARQKAENDGARLDRK
jgi:hypothetical protein